MTSDDRAAHSTADPSLKSIWPDMLFAIRQIGIAVTTGAFAGLLAGGVGSRVVMRMVAMIAGADAAGALTDNGNIVGEFTGEGTGFLLVAGMFAGLLGGLAYLAFRALVPMRSPWRGLAFGVTLFGLIGWTIVDHKNPDFRLFGSPVVNVALFALLFPLFGLSIDGAFGSIHRLLPGGGGATTGWTSVVAVTVLSAMGLVTIVALLLAAGLRGGAPLALLGVVYVLVALGVARWSERGADTWRRFARVAVIYAPVLAAISLGTVRTVSSVARILA